MTSSSLTSSKDLEFGDVHIDVASSDKRLVRVTTNTYKNSGLTYINIKLFKKNEDQDDFRMQQRVGLTVKEFHEIIANVETLAWALPVQTAVRGRRKSTRGLLKAIRGWLTSRSQKLLIRRNEKLYNSFQK